MSGHSKWNNIKNKKGVTDAKRGKLFSQLSKNIRIAVREGKSGDPKFNPSLRLMVEKARQANMPNENIQRAIDRGLGKGKGGAIEQMIYEGYAPGGVGMIIVAMSENHQRTAAEVRSILSKAGGSLGSPGSAMFMFEFRDEEYFPSMPMQLDDEQQIEKLTELIDQLRSNEDVEDVFVTGIWEDNE